MVVLVKLKSYWTQDYFPYIYYLYTYNIFLFYNKVPLQIGKKKFYFRERLDNGDKVVLQVAVACSISLLNHVAVQVVHVEKRNLITLIASIICFIQFIDLQLEPRECWRI